MMEERRENGEGGQNCIFFSKWGHAGNLIKNIFAVVFS